MGFLLYISYYGILLYGCIPSGLTMTKIKDYDLITVDEHRIQTTIDVYFQWKTLDIMLSTLSTRGINFPSEISENIVCYTCGYFLNKGSSGDAIDPNGNRIIEIKGSSSTGPSSFSPSERFDELVFVKLNKQNDTLLIYLTGINNVSLGNIYVNATETLLEQQLAGRRPRFKNVSGNEIIKTKEVTVSLVFFLTNYSLSLIMSINIYRNDVLTCGNRLILIINTLLDS